MASSTENTFGTKIQNAQNLLTCVQSFASYTPLRPTDSIAEMTTLVNNVLLANNTESSKSQLYTLAVEARQKQFSKKDDGISTILTSIIATVRALYGKSSKETISINEKVIKLRGSQKPKSSKNPEEKNISTTQQSYASVTQNFADLIVSLEALTPAFNSPNPNITIPKLKERLDLMRQTTNTVTTTLSELVQARTTRDNLYSDLKERCLRIKENIKAQYGTKSSEYTMVKGLKF
jgi:hypothetical protein